MSPRDGSGVRRVCCGIRRRYCRRAFSLVLPCHGNHGSVMNPRDGSGVRRVWCGIHRRNRRYCRRAFSLVLPLSYIIHVLSPLSLLILPAFTYHLLYFLMHALPLRSLSAYHFLIYELLRFILLKMIKLN